MMMALKIMLLASFVGKSHAGICAVDSDYKADLVVEGDCTGVNETQCVGLPLDWSSSDKKCTVKYGTWLSKEDGTELKAACAAKGGTFSGEKKCSTYLGMAYPSGFTASATSCNTTSTINPGWTNAKAVAYLGENMGCCGVGQTSCNALGSFQLCKTGFKAHSLAQVDCFGLAKAKCTGTADGAKFDSDAFDTENGKCRLNSRAIGTNLVNVCTKHGGYAKSVTLCGQYADHFFPGLKASKTTCEAESSNKGQTNKQMATMIASQVFSCCESGSTTCCDDPEFCAKAASSTTGTSSATGTTGTSSTTGTTAGSATTSSAYHTGAPAAWGIVAMALLALVA